MSRLWPHVKRVDQREWWPPAAIESVHVIRSYDYEAHGIYDVRHSDYRSGGVCDKFTAREALRPDSSCYLSDEHWTVLRLWVKSPEKGALPHLARHLSIDLRLAAQKLRNAQEVVAAWARDRA